VEEGGLLIPEDGMSFPGIARTMFLSVELGFGIDVDKSRD